MTWVEWLLRQPGHEWMVAVDDSFIGAYAAGPGYGVTPGRGVEGHCDLRHARARGGVVVGRVTLCAAGEGRCGMRHTHTWRALPPHTPGPPPRTFTHATPDSIVCRACLPPPPSPVAEDGFNLYGLRAIIPMFRQSLDIIMGDEPSMEGACAWVLLRVGRSAPWVGDCRRRVSQATPPIERRSSLHTAALPAERRRYVSVAIMHARPSAVHTTTSPTSQPLPLTADDSHLASIEACRDLYGLIHARFIMTARGVSLMVRVM